MKYKIIGQNKKEDFLKEIFENRGMTINNIQNYLHTNDSDINDYNLLDNINIATELYMKHLENNSKILLIVDPDVDGLTSSALFYNFTKEVKKDANISFVMHSEKQHGITDDLDVDYSLYDLIVIPDASSNDFVQHKELSKSADIIVLDHHESDLGYSEFAVVINNQLSKNYPNKQISGVGIVWQFCRAFNDTYNLGIDVNRYLDIVALGNIADMQDLRSIETKHLVTKGLENINNLMFKSFCEDQSYSLKDKITAEGVAWYIAPSLNSVVRIGTEKEKRMLFKAFLDEYASKEVASTKRGSADGDTEIFCQQAIRTAKNIRNRQNRLVEEGLEKINKMIKEESLDKNKVLLVEIPKDLLPPQVIGLVANKLANTYQLPTLIVEERIDNEKELKDGEKPQINLGGSGRNIEYSPIESFRDLLNSSNLMHYNSGHASAFGTSFPKENKDKIINFLNKELSEIMIEPCPKVDFAFDYIKERKLLENCILEIGSITKEGCWGTGIKEPLIAITNIPVNSYQVMGAKKNTIKIVENKISFIKFFAKEEDFKPISSGFQQNTVSIIGKCNLNEWYGNVSLQVIIDELEIEVGSKYIF